MRMKPVLFAGVIVVGAGVVGGYYYTQSYARALWVAGIADYQKSWPAGSSLTYGSLTVSGLGRSAEIGDIAIEIPVKFGMLDAKASVKIAKATINDVGGSADAPRIGHLALTDIKNTDGSFATKEVVLDNLTVAPGLWSKDQLDLKKMSFDHVKIGDLSFKKKDTDISLNELTAKNMKDGYIDTINYKNLITKVVLPENNGLDVIYDECTYSHVPAAMWGQFKFLEYTYKTVDCKNFEEKTKGFSIKFKSFKTETTEEDAQGRVKHLKMVADKININLLEKQVQFELLMQKLGIQDLNGNLALDLTLDHEKGDFQVSTTLSLNNIGDYGFGFNLVGFQADRYMTSALSYYNAVMDGRNPQEAILKSGFLDGLKNIRFSSADISYTDKGLVTAALAMAGPAVPPEQMAKQVAVGAAFGLGSVGLNDLGADWGQKLGAFVTKPGKISLHIAPEKPFGMTEGMEMAAKQAKPADIVTLMKPVLTVEPAQ